MRVWFWWSLLRDFALDLLGSLSSLMLPFYVTGEIFLQTWTTHFLGINEGVKRLF